MEWNEREAIERPNSNHKEFVVSLLFSLILLKQESWMLQYRYDYSTVDVECLAAFVDIRLAIVRREHSLLHVCHDRRWSEAPRNQSCIRRITDFFLSEII